MARSVVVRKYKQQTRKKQYAVVRDYAQPTPKIQYAVVQLLEGCEMSSNKTQQNPFALLGEQWQSPPLSLPGFQALLTTLSKLDFESNENAGIVEKFSMGFGLSTQNVKKCLSQLRGNGK